MLKGIDQAKNANFKICALKLNVYKNLGSKRVKSQT